MNKYELTLIVNAKIEDDARAATVEKAKEYITRFGGTVTEVEDWGKRFHEQAAKLYYKEKEGLKNDVWIWYHDSATQKEPEDDRVHGGYGPAYS